MKEEYLEIKNKLESKQYDLIISNTNLEKEVKNILIMIDHLNENQIKITEECNIPLVQNGLNQIEQLPHTFELN